MQFTAALRKLLSLGLGKSTDAGVDPCPGFAVFETRAAQQKIRCVFGKDIWHLPLGAAIYSTTITFEPDGKQYVVNSGRIHAFCLCSPLALKVGHKA